MEKYHVNFIYDVGAYLATLDKVEALTGKYFIPAHAPTVEDIRPLCALNRDKVHEIGALLCEICTKPISWETILQKVFDHYELTMDFNQYVLVGSTVRSYLAWLSDQGRLTARFEDNRLLWERA